VVARVDQATDPAVLRDLALVRAGTAYFRRILNNLSDDQLAKPSSLEGWTRKHVVAHVGYNARALARLVEWAATGDETPMYESPEARNREIEFGATLGAEALRHLCDHSAIDLDVRWRDLPADRWQVEVVTAQGRTVPASETVWMRTREVWLHALDLDAGGRIEDLPDPALERLLGDVVRTWQSRDQLDGLAVVVDTGTRLGDPCGGRQVHGDLRGLVLWATGRGGGDTLQWTGGAVPAPRWI
jgi:maleylpyruvate isomerase